MPASLPQPVTSTERPSRRRGPEPLGRDDAVSGGRVGSRGHSDRGEAISELGGVRHLRGHRRRRHHRQERSRPGHARADRRLGDRGGAGGCGDRAHPRARPADRHGARDPRAVPRGRAADPRVGRRRRAQPDGRHGRRPRAGRCRVAAAARRRGHRHGRRDRAAGARRRAAARDLHARLRHDELRRGRRLRHGQHAPRCCARWRRTCRSSACGRSSRSSTPGTWSSSRSSCATG